MFKASLEAIKTITNRPVDEFIDIMIQKCCAAGVALVFVPELPKTLISGATKWLTNNKAMIILSLRHKSDDHFWFSFFHEAAHILLHGKTDVFIDSLDSVKDKKEVEADEFAGNILIPAKQYDEFVLTGTLYKDDIKEFAEQLNIAPGILVGRLQYEKLIKFSWHNDLKRKFEFIE